MDLSINTGTSEDSVVANSVVEDWKSVVKEVVGVVAFPYPGSFPEVQLINVDEDSILKF